jgi:hypothetical protein
MSTFSPQDSAELQSFEQNYSDAPLADRAWSQRVTTTILNRSPSPASAADFPAISNSWTTLGNWTRGNATSSRTRPPIAAGTFDALFGSDPEGLAVSYVRAGFSFRKARHGCR